MQMRMQSGQKASAQDAFFKRKIDGLIAQKLREAKTLADMSCMSLYNVVISY